MFEIVRLDDDGLVATRSYSEMKAFLGITLFVALGGGGLASLVTGSFWYVVYGFLVATGATGLAMLHGLQKATYTFVHAKSEFSVATGQDAKSQDAKTFSYADMRIHKELSPGRDGRLLTKYLVSLPGIFKNVLLLIPDDNAGEFEEFLNAFNGQQLEAQLQKDEQRFLEEKAAGEHALSMPTGAASKAGTPVAIPASLSFDDSKKDE